jgi:hypothetical protein
MRLTLVRHGLAVLGAAAACSAFGPGCAKPDSELFIRGVLVPAQYPDCTVQAQADSLVRGYGVLDVAFPGNDYVAPMLVGDQLVARGSNELVRTETSKVSFTSADVRLEDSAGNEIKSFSVPVSGFADESQGSSAGYGLAYVTLIDGATGSLLSGDGSFHRVVSKTRLFGQTLGGDDVQSEEFEFVIETCFGCLIARPSDELDDKGQCLPTAGSTAAASTTPVPCRKGQDDTVDCSICTDNVHCVKGTGP